MQESHEVAVVVFRRSQERFCLADFEAKVNAGIRPNLGLPPVGPAEFLNCPETGRAIEGRDDGGRETKHDWRRAVAVALGCIRITCSLDACVRRRSRAARAPTHRGSW